MTIMLNTNTWTLYTWIQLAAWYHIHWLRVIGGYDFGFLKKEETKKLARRMARRLNRDLYRRRDAPYTKDTDLQYRKVLDGVLRHLDECLRNWDKLADYEVREMSYRISNVLAEGIIL